MKELYYLSDFKLPIIPTPHDCVIDKIEFNGIFLTFFFEKDITYHDSISVLNKNARSLIIRFHLTDDFDIFKHKVTNIFIFKSEKYVKIKNEKFLNNKKYKTEYLYHTVGYQKINVSLYQNGFVNIVINADYVELEWIE